jgi:outer membrane protein assembly factor BamB
MANVVRRFGHSLLCSSLLLTGLVSVPFCAAAGEQVVGWRGDGTGHYPDATPPTTWSRSEGGETKNILWQTKLPCYSWATPIIVGDKIFVRSEPYDLICLNKKDGKILWIRSHGPFTAISDDEKKANPAFNEIAPLVAKLNAANDNCVASGLNPALLKEKHDLQKQIDEALGKIDPKYKLPKDMWNESWSGYTGMTPCSDGKFVFLTSLCGVTAAYDLDGKKIWSRYERGGDAGEHGLFWSPGLAGEKLLVAPVPVKPGQYELSALNKVTGAEIWRQTYTKGRGWCCAVLPFKVGGTEYAWAWKNFIRVSDGKSVYAGTNTDAAGAVIQDDQVFTLELEARVKFFKLEPAGNGELQVVTPIKDPYQAFDLPIDKPPSGKCDKVSPVFSKACANCPLYHDGLLYILETCGRLVVYDTQKTTVKDSLVYANYPPFEFKNPFHRHTYGCGVGASPALAGKYIYLMDSAGCTIVIEPGREYKQVAKNTIDFNLPGWEPGHYEGNPRHEVTLSTPIFEGNRIYIRGEQFLYCIGEK